MANPPRRPTRPETSCVHAGAMPLAASFGLNTPIVTSSAFDARVTPHMSIIDADGILVYMGGIDSNPSANSNDIPGATQYVMLALQEMAAGQPISNPVTRPYGCIIKY
ncbi:MAG: hypothetical protein ACXIUM_11440 [Wenzhouxiangella sp.]